MYSIVLVDDEAEVRDSMADGVDWAKLGFEVKGLAQNGLEALGLIEAEEPDVVMTDIKMPYMDGLQLSAKIRERYDNMKIVIFSGYDDFSYAKEAIKYKVENYIMKPINSRELEEAMLDIKKLLDNERDTERNLKLLAERYADGLPRITENLLQQLLRGVLNDDIKRQLSENRPDMVFAGAWIVASIKVEAENNSAELIYKAIEDELQKKHMIAAVRENDKIDIIFAQGDVEIVINAIENLERNMMHRFGVEIRCGIGCPRDMLGSITESYAEALKALAELSFEEGRDIRYFGDLCKSKDEEDNSPVAKAIAYIRLNYSDAELSVEMVADSVGFSHSYFSSIFKKETGEACSSFITKVRMEEAARLLNETDSKTYIIAKETGYADVAYFSYAFKHHFGVAPTKYRQSR